MSLPTLSPQKMDWIPFLHTFKQIFSSEHLNEIAVQHGFKKRNRKIKPEDFIALCAFYHEETGYQGCAQSSLKIQVEYEMKQGQFLHLDIRNGKEHDTTYAATLLHTVQPGDLLLRDLGYFSLDGLKSIHEQGGYYISRVKHNVKIYFTKERTEEPKCAEDFIKDLAPGETMEVHHVSISQKRIPQPRLILYRLTEKQERDREEKWNQRRKKSD